MTETNRRLHHFPMSGLKKQQKIRKIDVSLIFSNCQRVVNRFIRFTKYGTSASQLADCERKTKAN